MRIFIFLFLLEISRIHCVPAAFYNTFEENPINNDTETINEGDEAAPCLVSDILYNHGQQIERQNECDYCLCVDGDMFCYWQCVTKQSSNTISIVVSHTESTPVQFADAENYTSVLFEKFPQNNTNAATEIEISAENGITNITGTQANSTIKANNQTCIVAGREYAEGDILPQEEGSCLQCVCGPHGRVTCSPQDCVSLQQDRYRHGIESNSLDMFDVDIF